MAPAALLTAGGGGEDTAATLLPNNFMDTKSCGFSEGSLPANGQTTSTENQSEIARENSWNEQMALLEMIHEEISPQLEALRAADADYVLDLPIFEMQS